MIMPLSIIIILLLLAITFYHHKKKFSYICLIFATLLLGLGSFRPVANLLMAPIENQHIAFTKSSEPVDYIILLGCKHTTDAQLPATSELGICSLQRLVEAVRILRIHPEAQLITSGYAGHDQTSNAEKVKQAAILLGIAESKIAANIEDSTKAESKIADIKIMNFKIAANIGDSKKADGKIAGIKIVNIKIAANIGDSKKKLIVKQLIL